MPYNKYSFTTACEVPFSKTTIEKLKSRYIAFDTETTGLNPIMDKIIELGAVLFENGQPVKTFNTLINPGIYIPQSITAINHITNEMVNKAPSEDVAYLSFVDFLDQALVGDTLICAHNAHFDMRFLCQAFNRLELIASFCYVDTLAISRKMLPFLTNHKLNTVAKYFNIINEKEHRAYEDAKTCGEILWQFLQKEEL